MKRQPVTGGLTEYERNPSRRESCLTFLLRCSYGRPCPMGTIVMLRRGSNRCIRRGARIVGIPESGLSQFLPEPPTSQCPPPSVVGRPTRTDRSLSVSQLLYAAKGKPQDTALGGRRVWNRDHGTSSDSGVTLPQNRNDRKPGRGGEKRSDLSIRTWWLIRVISR